MFPSITRTVRNKLDSCFVANAALHPDATAIYLGNWKHRDENPPFHIHFYPSDAAFRWTDITIPPLSTILHANILLGHGGAFSDTYAHIRFRIELSPNAQRITSPADFAARTLSVSYVDWLFDTTELKISTVQSPDLQPLLAGLIASHDLSDAAIQIFALNNSTLEPNFATCMYKAPAEPIKPKLQIYYQTAPHQDDLHWLLTDLSYVYSGTNKIITTATDVDVRTRLRFTDQPPSPHIRQTYRRGLPDRRDPGLEMKEFAEITQAEPGDTLAHTHTVPDWLPGETRHFYFIGTIKGSDTPSRTPFFAETRPLPTTQVVVLEPWDWEIAPPPVYTILVLEPWDWEITPPPAYAIVVNELWSS